MEKFTLHFSGVIDVSIDHKIRSLQITDTLQFLESAKIHFDNFNTNPMN